MAIKFLVTKGRNMKDPNGKELYQARSIQTGKITTGELCESISDRCSVTASDVMGVISNLEDVLIHEMMYSRIVRLGQFGSFRLAVAGELVASPELWTRSLLRRARIVFTPGEQLRTALEGMNFSMGGYSEAVREVIAKKENN